MNKDYKNYAMLMKALGDENRAKIFDMLSQGERCACKILDEFSVTQSTLSYHMKILCDSGLVNGRKDGIWTYYTINPDKLELIKDFFDRINPSEINIDMDCCKGGS
ncbi:MAG: metalloregulator ArsR/SmtB family transcription factor [Eubacteriales bacterium]|nr:metalloregulator ArsR/SmtB family transcription factor [Eubacteriales bacterium]